MTSWAISYAPSPPPNPALESVGQAWGPVFSRVAAVQVPVPSRFRVSPAGPITLIWVIGEGTGRLVEPIVAAPNTFVGTPSASGENPAWVIVTVSSACAAPAPTPSKSAQPTNVMAMARTPSILGISLSHPFPTPVYIDPPGDSLLRSEEHTSELQSLRHLVCRLLLHK